MNFPDLKEIFTQRGFPIDYDAVGRLLIRFPNPQEVANGLLAFAEETCPRDNRQSRETFFTDTLLRRNLSQLTATADAPLLHFPPGSQIFQIAARHIPWILEEQIQAIFPGLDQALRVIAPWTNKGKPFLSQIHSITFQDVLTGVMVATTGVYHLELADPVGYRFVLKRTDMSIERVIAIMLEKWLDLPAVNVLTTNPLYSTMAQVNGYSLREISGNPLAEPRRKTWDSVNLTALARVFGQEAALASGLKLYSRHSGNVICSSIQDINHSGFVRIDFGQAFLPTRNLYTETVMPLWHVRRFFPDDTLSHYESPLVYGQIFQGFKEIAFKIISNLSEIKKYLNSAVGLHLPEMEAETSSLELTTSHVHAIMQNSATMADAGSIFNRIYNNFYRYGFQVCGWTEYHTPRSRIAEHGEDDFYDILKEKKWDK